MKILPEALKQYVGDALPETATIEKLFTFHAFEVEGVERIGEYEVIDVKVLPDRSSDCLSHRGLAHELAALIDTPLEKDPLRTPIALEPITNKLSVTIENPDHCRRFSAALVTGVTIAPSPEWLKNTLEALGQRSINNVVDATNYAMLMLGQPLHAYDAEKFKTEAGKWQFGVRMAQNGESITTLTGETYELNDLVQLITNESDAALAGIAGVKGGKYAEVDSTTTTIIIEAANFDAVTTRRASQFLKLQTDASKRFENNLSPELTAYGLTLCVDIIREIAGGTCDGFLDVYPNPKQNTCITLTEKQLESHLGLSINRTVVELILVRLGFVVESIEAGWKVTAPFERTDVTIAEDVIADIGRVHDYNHIESVVPKAVPLTEINARQYYSEQIRSLLLKTGYSEVITSSFRAKDDIQLANALASDKGYLRSTLRKNIIETLDRNIPFADLVGVTAVRLFEIGTIFKRAQGSAGIDEVVSLAIGIRQKQTGHTPKDDDVLKALAIDLETTLGEPLHATIEKGVLECNLSSLIARLPKPSAYEPYQPGPEISYRPFSTFPFVSRDIALWVPETTSAESVEALIQEPGGSLLVRTTCFDTFAKEGRVSYAFRLIFQAADRTLTDDEVGKIMTTITQSLETQGYVIR